MKPVEKRETWRLVQDLYSVTWEDRPDIQPGSESWFSVTRHQSPRRWRRRRRRRRWWRRRKRRWRWRRKRRRWRRRWRRWQKEDKRENEAKSDEENEGDEEEEEGKGDEGREENKVHKEKRESALMMDKEKEIRKEERREREKGRVLNYNAGWWLGKKEKSGKIKEGNRERERRSLAGRVSIELRELSVWLRGKQNQRVWERTTELLLHEYSWGAEGSQSVCVCVCVCVCGLVYLSNSRPRPGYIP